MATARLRSTEGVALALSALPVMTRARELGRPLDLFIFPGEQHNKIEPAHRLAIYDRALDWFDFWLRGIENPSESRELEYRTWRVWRLQRRGNIQRRN